MLKNYLKIAIRNILNGKIYSAINITGLVIGLTSFIFIFLYVQDQNSYDVFNKKADRIYRLNKVNKPNIGTEERHAISSGMMGPTIVNEFPEVEQAVRVLPWFSDVLFKYDNKEFKISDVVFTDSNFLNVFDYSLYEGNENTALIKPMSIILSEDMAKLFFGNDDPVGKIIYDSDNSPFKVTGIIENTPTNSHLRYNILVSWSTTINGTENWQMSWANNWLTQVEYTYLLLKSNTNYKELEKKFPALIKKNLPAKTDQYHLYLQPLRDIHLGSSDLLYTRGTNIGNETYVRILFFAAVMILLIASFNFMNLTSARALKKSKEVGVRKTFGARKSQIIKQFLIESILITFLSIIIAVLFIEILLPLFNRLTDVSLDIKYPQLLLIIGVLTLTVGTISGLYPALFLSKFNSANVFRGAGISKKGKNIPRKISVAVQFIISAFMITSTVVIYSQMKYVQNKDLGFNPDQLIVLETGDTRFSKKVDAFKNELLKSPNIVSVCLTNTIPGEGTMGFKIEPENKPESIDYISETIRVGDDDFARTYDIEVLKGRYFSKDFPTDETNGIVINQTLANKLGWKNPIGKKLNVKGEVKDGIVIGEVKDFHMTSLHHKIGPTLVYFKSRNAQTVSVKVKATDISSTIKFIKDTWQKFDPEYPFDYKFLNKSFAQLYKSDLEMMNVFSLFAGLAIFVACLGLFGLVTFSSERRKKEISIRKVLGAKTNGIVILLSKEFLAIISISTLISWPATYYLMNSWLEDFAYKINLSIWMFLLAGILSLTVALLTMAYQALKVASSNPVNSLRYE